MRVHKNQGGSGMDYESAQAALMRSVFTSSPPASETGFRLVPSTPSAIVPKPP